MRSLSLKSKAWVYVGLFTATLLVLSLSLLIAGYYWFSINSIKKDLMNATNEVVTDQMVYEEGQILFKRDSLDRTVSAYLRDVNMSAVIFDSKIKPFATYGVYQVLTEEKTLEKVVDLNNIKEVLVNNQPDFREKMLSNNEEYYILTTPILFSGNKVGVIQMASKSSLFGQIKDMGLYILGGVVLVSILISWPLSRVLVNILFEPLETVVTAMERARVTNLNVPLSYNKNTKDEVGVVVEAYNNMLKRISDGLEKQKAFIANASHELKTPISRTVSTLELASMDLEEGAYEELLGRLTAAKEDLMGFSHLIEEMLILSKVDTGMVKVERKVIKLRDLVIKSTEAHLKEAEEKVLKMVNRIGDEEKVVSDPTYLQIVFSNLISNAIKYSHAGGEIIIDEETNKEMVMVKIRDEGVGIKREEIHRVFERFFRSSGVAAHTSGFGIGMSLVKQLCGILGLKVEYNQGMTKGTEVMVSGLKMG